jgi:hypothetical protein
VPQFEIPRILRTICPDPTFSKVAPNLCHPGTLRVNALDGSVQRSALSRRNELFILAPHLPLRDCADLHG